MNLPELAAFVALITDDTERRFGADSDVAKRDAYAREAALDLWMTQPGVTVATANRVWRQVRDELRRRWNRRQERADQRQIAVAGLLAELTLPPGHCPNRPSARQVLTPMNAATQALPRQLVGTERSGTLAIR
jgi:hypothetical protein